MAGVRSETSVLLVCANPRGSDPLRTAEEDRTLRESVQLSPHRAQIRVDTLNAATVDDLRRALLNRDYDIVHFSGHGTKAGLVFEDAVGRLMIPTSTALADLFKRRRVATVVFNACYSLSVGRIASVGVEYTIASTGPIADTAAIEFTRGFYDAIGAGRTVPDAYAEGMSAAQLKGFQPDVILLRQGEEHVGRRMSTPVQIVDRTVSKVLVGVALDTSGSMRDSIRNETGGALSRLEGAQRALKQLGWTVQNELRNRQADTDATDNFRVFAYAFGLRYREVGDLFGLFQAARTTDVKAEVEQRRWRYENEARQRASGYGGLADLARQYGFGGLVDTVAGAARTEAERGIRDRITREVADLIFAQSEKIGDVTLSADGLSELWGDESDLTVNSVEPLVYGSTPMSKVATEVNARFGRTFPNGEGEKRVLVVISDGEPTDGDPREIFAQIRDRGVTLVSCFVTDENIAEPRELVATPKASWGNGARLMFEIASPLDEKEPFSSQLLAQGWTIEPAARLFVQVNHSEILDEFVRAVGADITLTGAIMLPAGR